MSSPLVAVGSGVCASILVLPVVVACLIYFNAWQHCLPRQAVNKRDVLGGGLIQRLFV